MHTRKHTGGPHRWNSKAVLILALVLLLGTAIGGTIAFLTDTTADVENTFTVAQVVGTIEENVSNNKKTSITIENEGNIPCYVRVALVSNWVIAEGENAGQICTNHDAPPAVDYNTTDWVLSEDGFYYHKTMVEPTKSTKNLLDGNVELVTEEDGCKLQLEVLSSVIQAVGVTYVGNPAVAVPAVVDAWSSGVSAVANDGSLTIKQ